jgi:hypothetical protein
LAHQPGSVGPLAEFGKKDLRALKGLEGRPSAR